LNQLEDDCDEEKLLQLESDLILSTEEKRNRSCEGSTDYGNVVYVPVVLSEDSPAESGDANNDIEEVKESQAEVDVV